MRDSRVLAARGPVLGWSAVLNGCLHRSGADHPALAPRRRRVGWAIFTIAVLSLADLYFTLLYARTVGMSEANPIARMVMSFNSPALLALWKCATVAGACLIFWCFRHKAATEAAAWSCGLLLAGLTVWWSLYTQHMPTCVPGLDEFRHLEGQNWVLMPD